MNTKGLIINFVYILVELAHNLLNDLLIYIFDRLLRHSSLSVRSLPSNWREIVKIWFLLEFVGDLGNYLIDSLSSFSCNIIVIGTWISHQYLGKSGWEADCFTNFDDSFNLFYGVIFQLFNFVLFLDLNPISLLSVLV